MSGAAGPASAWSRIARWAASLTALSMAAGALGDGSFSATLTSETPGEVLFFGHSVAVVGDRAAVGAHVTLGAPLWSGSVETFRRKDGAWIPWQTLVPLDPMEAGFYGFDVALSETTLVVGSPGDSTLGAVSGAAYVYEVQGDGWSFVGKLTASDGGDLDKLGISVAIHGDLLVVGAPSASDAAPRNSNCFSGAAYVFERVAGVWTETAKLLASNLACLWKFGDEVATDGHRIVIGCRPYIQTGGEGPIAFVFERVGGSWTETAALHATLPGGGGSDGFNVEVQDDLVMVGIPTDSEGGQAAGAVALFEPVRGQWILTQQVVAAQPAPLSLFGRSVAICGPLALIGAMKDSGAGFESGAAYVFARGAAGWAEVAKLVSPVTPAGELMGFDVALDGTTALVGAYNDTVPCGATTCKSGSAHLFDLAGFLPLPGDLDVDGTVGPKDLGVLLSGWGLCPGAPGRAGGCFGDLDDSGSIDGLDLGALLAGWTDSG